MPTADTLILTINPGSTSTKVALFSALAAPQPEGVDEPLREVWAETITHSAAELAKYSRIADQFGMRRADIAALLDRKQTKLAEVGMVVGRGGLFRAQVSSGTYAINQAMVDEMQAGDPGGQREHASNLGVPLATSFADEAGAGSHYVPRFIVDPPPVDEMPPVAHLTGWPEITRRALAHVLSVKAAGRKAGRQLGKPYNQLNLVITHLGGGISVTAHRLGQMVDENQALDGEGPFSPERSGGLPVGDLARICFSGQYTYAEVMKKIAGRGGLVAHLGTNDAREVEQRIAGGDQQAELVYRAMAYNIGKGVGHMAAALGSRPDALVFTGSLCYSAMLISWISAQVEWIAPLIVYPGSLEMQALAAGGWRVLQGTEQAKEYVDGGAAAK